MNPKTKKILWIVICAFILVYAVGILIAAQVMWLDDQFKFQDVTIELGQDTVSIDQFTTEYADLSQVSFACDVSAIDLSKPDQHLLTLQHGNKQERVVLTIQDTTAPQVTFVEKLEVTSGYEPNAQDFITEVIDADSTTVAFETQPVITPGYGNVDVTVVVTDESGNSVKRDCVIVYSWLKEEVKLEYGQSLTTKDLLYNPKQDEALVDQKVLDEISASPLGSYTITSTTESKTQICTVTVEDTTAPALELQEVKLRPGKEADMEDFIVSYSDASGNVDVKMLTALDFDTLGHQTVVFEATDPTGNVNRQETLLIVTDDMTAPSIKGTDVTLEVEKNSSPDFLAGITATDKVSGECTVTVDTSELDLTTAGTYYIKYSAMDASHNVKTAKRKVVVLRNEEDTKLLVQNIAAKLSDDPEKLRNYVRSRIYYNHSWGGDDPVYYGFTKRGGNCYVHAVCLKALFDEKGIESQLIWVTNKTHYWLIVKIDGQWKHIDPTPGRLHSRYSLMNDKQRLSTLSGRKWDRSAWPACE